MPASWSHQSRSRDFTSHSPLKFLLARKPPNSSWNSTNVLTWLASRESLSLRALVRGPNQADTTSCKILNQFPDRPHRKSFRFIIRRSSFPSLHVTTHKQLWPDGWFSIDWFLCHSQLASRVAIRLLRFFCNIFIHGIDGKLCCTGDSIGYHTKLCCRTWTRVGRNF